MSRPVISGRQLAWLLVTFVFTSYDNVGWLLARTAGPDSIFSYAAPIFYAFLIALLFYTLNRKFPAKNIFEISFIVAGRVGGTIMNVIVLLHIWMIFARNLMHSASFLNNALLRYTQPEIIILLFVCVMIYYGKTSIEVAARVNELIVLMFSVLLMLFPIMLINEFSATQWEPILTQPPAQVVLGNVYGATQFGDMFLIGAFLHTLQNAKQLLASLRHGIVAAAFSLTLITVMCVAVFGGSVFSKLSFPGFSLSTEMHVTDFLDRVEIFLYIPYLPLLIISAVIAFFAFQTGFTSFSRRSEATVYSRSLGWLLMLTALISFRSNSELAKFYMYGYPVFVVLVQPLLIVLYFVLAYRFPNAPIQDDNQAGNGEKDAVMKSGRLSNRTWTHLTNWMAVSVVALVAIGIAFASDYPLVGNLSFLAYGLCMVFAVYTSYNEIKSV
jgi:spore germination protein KB